MGKAVRHVAVILFGMTCLACSFSVFRGVNEWQMTDGVSKDTYCATNIRNTVMPVADARASSSRLASYDTEMLLGGVFRELGQPDSSEVHFRKAAVMCPSRISPLYYLFLLYERQGEIEDMSSIGKQLLSKPVKVPSAKTRAMRLDVRKRM